MKLPLLFLFLLAACFLTVSAQADIVVIANVNSPIDTLTREEVKRIYLKKLKNLAWVNHLDVFPIGQSSDYDMENAFYAQVAQKDRYQLRAYWARLLFTGKDKPPRDGWNDEGVMQLVSEHSGAIGFIRESALRQQFKVIFRLK